MRERESGRPPAAPGAAGERGREGPSPRPPFLRPAVGRESVPGGVGSSEFSSGNGGSGAQRSGRSERSSLPRQAAVWPGAARWHGGFLLASPECRCSFARSSTRRRADFAGLSVFLL